MRLNVQVQPVAYRRFFFFLFDKVNYLQVGHHDEFVLKIIMFNYNVYFQNKF